MFRLAGKSRSVFVKRAAQAVGAAIAAGSAVTVTAQPVLLSVIVVIEYEVVAPNVTEIN
mgnify:CR=1 FL=1